MEHFNNPNVRALVEAENRKSEYIQALLDAFHISQYFVVSNLGFGLSCSAVRNYMDKLEKENEFRIRQGKIPLNYLARLHVFLSKFKTARCTHEKDEHHDYKVCRYFHRRFKEPRRKESQPLALSRDAFIFLMTPLTASYEREKAKLA